MTTTALSPGRTANPRPVAAAIIAAIVVVLGVLALVGIRLASSSSETAPRPAPVASVPVHAHPAPRPAPVHAHPAPLLDRNAGTAGLSATPHHDWTPPATASTNGDRDPDW